MTSCWKMLKSCCQPSLTTGRSGAQFAARTVCISGVRHQLWNCRMAAMVGSALSWMASCRPCTVVAARRMDQTAQVGTSSMIPHQQFCPNLLQPLQNFRDGRLVVVWIAPYREQERVCGEAAARARSDQDGHAEPADPLSCRPSAHHGRQLVAVVQERKRAAFS